MVLKSVSLLNPCTNFFSLEIYYWVEDFKQKNCWKMKNYILNIILTKRFWSLSSIAGKSFIIFFRGVDPTRLFAVRSKQKKRLASQGFASGYWISRDLKIVYSALAQDFLFFHLNQSVYCPISTNQISWNIK